MGTLTTFFSILFFFACTISCFLAVYILYIDATSSINRVFFFMCISLSIWSLGFSISIAAPNVGICLLGRRISAIGWGTIFAEILLFFMILTEKKNVLNKWWIYSIIFLPSAICLYVFAISNELAPIQYKLVNTQLGWINIAFNNGWDLFFYLYYVGYMIIGLAMLWNWKKKLIERKNKVQANIIFYSFISTVIIGSVTDIIGNTLWSLNIPQIAPIIMVFPLVSIYYAIRKYSLMNKKPVSEAELIINESNSNKIFNYITFAFIAGSFVNFVTQYLVFDNANLANVLLVSTLILIVGLLIQIIKRLKLSENNKKNIIVIIMVISIPVITLKFIEFASVTVWAISFIFIIISLVFNKRITFISMAISVVFTQVLVWIMVPKITLSIDIVDHIGRIGLLCIAIWLASYINRIFILRLKENADQISFQTLVSDISTSFVTINQSNFDEKINAMLEKCGKYFEVDRICLAIFGLDDTKIDYTHEWNIKKIEEFAIPLTDENTYWIEQIKSNQIVKIPDSKMISHEHVKHLVSIPIMGKDSILGFFEFNLIKTSKYFREDQINLLKIIVNTFAGAMRKVNSEKEINHMAYYDYLTGLPNHTLFKDKLGDSIQQMSTVEEKLGIIFLDLDSFKIVNDTMGHDGGNELLKKVAEVLSLCVKNRGMVSRFGGDEFLIMINNVSSKEEIVEIVENIMTLLNQSFMLKGQEFFVTASAGISMYPEDGEDTDTLIKNADAAMYRAKEQGKNQYNFCSTELKEELQTKMKLSNSLYRALERNELYILYQPQINIESKQIIGVEALLRWNNPDFGIIPPSVFIPLAEQTGLINSIGEWVLKMTCIQNKKWQEMGLPKITTAVNLSVNQFRNTNIVAQVDDILKETGLDPKYLELEITENIAIREAEYIIHTLDDLKMLGVYISIDDFGTGYSSLSRLEILPVDRIKIDIQFIRGIEANHKDRAITNSIIQLAKNLDLKVIAEGVETQAQLDFLKQNLCDEVQGYFYYKPMPAEEIEKILRSFK